MAHATNDYTAGTSVVYTAANTEAYTVTVPAQLAPGGSGTVTLEGTWASNQTVKVTADTSVTLTNSINAADTKTLAVAFAGIEKAGDNTESKTYTETVAVAEMPADVLFGTWSGKFNYNVDFTAGDAGDSGESSVTYEMIYKPTGESVDMTDTFTVSLYDIKQGHGYTSDNATSIEYTGTSGSGANKVFGNTFVNASPNDSSIMFVVEDLSVFDYGAFGEIQLSKSLLGDTVCELANYSVVVTSTDSSKTILDFSIKTVDATEGSIGQSDMLVVVYNYYDSNGTYIESSDAYTLWAVDADEDCVMDTDIDDGGIVFVPGCPARWGMPGNSHDDYDIDDNDDYSIDNGVRICEDMVLCVDRDNVLLSSVY